VIARNTVVRLGVALAFATGACGGRPAYWDTSPTGATSHGLATGVALVDDAAHRVVMVSALAGQETMAQSFPIGHHVTSKVTSPDGSRLFVLSTGDWPRRTKNDQFPSLSVIEASTFDPPPSAKKYEMTSPLPNLAVDPLRQWAVAYTGASASASFVQNANEIVIFDLTAPSGTPPLSRTIRSKGGTPQRLTFTPPLNLPKGPGRLLIIETDIDITLLELGSSASEVTVPLTSGKNAQQVAPAGVVVSSFDPNVPAEPRIALRANNNRNVFTFLLGPSDSGSDFTPIINVIDVGGVPTDIAFVRTDMGALRVAALVPTTSSAVLVDADTSVTTQVPLPAPYSKLSLITNVVAGTAGTDVAMLWSSNDQNASGVAFWLLGNAVGQPYFSVESIPVMQPITSVQDVANYDQLKVLQTSDASGFYVLDLLKRTASPLRTNAQATIAIAPDGQRLWAFARGSADGALAKVDLVCPPDPTANCGVLNPTSLVTDAPIDAVYDVARRDGGRSLIAMHTQGAVGATVFDAINPDTATARRIPALLLEGP
jgi:hypothetical protein